MGEYERSPIHPKMYSYCNTFAYDLLSANRKRENRFYLIAAEQYLVMSKSLIAEIEINSKYGQEKKYYADRNLRRCQAVLAEADREWDKAIRLQKEFLEMIRTDKYVDRSVDNFKELQAKRIAEQEKELSRLIKAKESAK